MSRPAKKRALAETTEQPPHQQQLQVATTTARRPVFSANLDASVYKAELEHERSLRALDARRAAQAQQSLERQIEFAVEEAQLAKSLLEEERKQSELHMEQLRQARDDAMQQLRELQMQSQHNYDSEQEEEEERDSLWKRKYELLQNKLDAKDEEMLELRNSLHSVQAQWEEMIEKKNKRPAEVPTTPTGGGIDAAASASAVEGQSSPAPTDLMAELRRVRIELAESERKQRQLRRAADEWQKKAKQLLPEREAAKSAQTRVQQLEMQQRDIRKQHESAMAQNEQWQAFGKTLSKHFALHQDTFTTPPEVSTIVRQAEASKRELGQVKETNRTLEQRLERLQDWKRPTEARMKALDEKETQWNQERKDLEKQLDLEKRQVETMQRQEAIWKREIAGLQRLVQTFDDLPLNTSGTGGNAEGVVSAKLQTIELELKSTKEELELVKQDRDRINQESTTATGQQQEQRQELDRVKEKYGKLREALEVQREKAQEAEARAIRAEELAGTGSFNPEETRVLHLQQNPRTETLQQQNIKLRKQLQEALQAKGGADGGDVNASMTVGGSSGSEVNPDKLHQRLKQSFKEQIGLFREGVHLITGYKIDMLPVEDHRPTFRVRSMYAEREDDDLMFKWPKLAEGQHPTSLDLLGTEWAKNLTATDSYQYVTKFNSIPSFLAALQLKLFESQTFMG